jgi:hypothetical protein
MGFGKKSDYLTGGIEYRLLPIFMKAYLRAVEQAYPQAWPTKVERDGRQVYSPFEYKFVLCKTTGMGAILRLIKDVYPIVSGLSNADEIFKKILLILPKLSESDIKKYFSKEGEFGGAGSEGLQTKLYKYLRTKLGLKID